MPNKVAVIFLHGSDSSGIEMKTFLNIITLPGYNNNSFVEVLDHLKINLTVPTASSRPFSALDKEVRNIWHDKMALSDMYDITVDTYEDILGINTSLNKIIDIVGDLCENNASLEAIYIGGFENGGSVALHVLRKYFEYEANLNWLHKVKGIFVMHHYLVPTSLVYTCLQNNKNNYKNTITNNKQAYINLPEIIMFGGLFDKEVSYDWVKSTATSLLLLGLDVTSKSYGKFSHHIHNDIFNYMPFHCYI